MDDNDKRLARSAVMIGAACVVSAVYALRLLTGNITVAPGTVDPARIWIVATCLCVPPNVLLAGVAAVRRNRSGWSGLIAGVIPGGSLALLLRREPVMDEAQRETRRARTRAWAAWAFAGHVPLALMLGLAPRSGKTEAIFGVWMLAMMSLAFLGGLIARLQGHKAWHGYILAILLWPAVFVMVFKRGTQPVSE
jgi:hypothetical protein